MAGERMDEFEVEVTPVRDDWEAVTDGVEGEPPVSARAPEPPFASVAAWSVRRRRLVTSLAAGALLLAMLAQLYAALPTTSGGTGSTSKVDPTTNPADGCVVSYQRAVDATNAEPQGIFFFRLGLLLAANDQAHTLFPALPVADARDKALMVTPTP